MPTRNQPALDFLLTRRSVPAKTMAGPVPDRAALTEILTAAARTPDHGKLEPWRFVVLTRPALQRLAADVERIGAATGRDAEQIAKGRGPYADGGLAVLVIAAPKPSDKIPEIEQVLSAGAVCLALLNAALAAGWAANWLSGWPSHDAAFRREALGLEPPEWVAGIIHIGSATSTPPDRPRPDLDRITRWVTA